MAIHFVDRKSRLDRTSNFSSSLPNANEKIPLKKFVVGEHDSRNTPLSILYAKAKSLINMNVSRARLDSTPRVFILFVQFV